MMELYINEIKLKLIMYENLKTELFLILLLRNLQKNLQIIKLILVENTSH